MASRLMIQRGLTASGAATTVTLVSWMGEQKTSMVTSKIASRSMEKLVANCNRSYFSSGVTNHPPYLKQIYKPFSTKAASEVSEKVATAPPPTTAAAAATTTAKKSMSFFEWYEGHLERHPVYTKMVTGSILWGVGDAVAQLVPQIAFGDNNNSSSEEGVTAKKPFKYDWPRTGRAVFFGFAIHAPTSHVHYEFLEWMTVKLGVTGLYIPIFKAFMEQFVYWSWISNSMYHAAMGAMQGMNATQIYKRIEDVLWDTQKAQWAFWIPVQLLNFQFVPVRHQLNVVLLTSIVWTALLSMWYPPVGEEEKEKVTTQDSEKKKQ